MLSIINKKELSEKAKIMAETLKIIANENRLMTICFLEEGEKTVGEITSFLEISQPAVSQMLIKMKEDGILSSRAVSQKIFYRVENRDISKLIKEISVFCKGIDKSSNKGKYL
jgi:DNA-binding transcriptional ArsR family regulator